MKPRSFILMLSLLLSFGAAVASADQGHQMGEMGGMPEKGGIRSKSKEEQIQVALSAAPP